VTDRDLKRTGAAAVAVILFAVAACTSDRSSGESDSPSADFQPNSAEEFRQPWEVSEPKYSKTRGEGWFAKACSLPLEYVRRIRRGYFPGRGPDIALVNDLPHNFGGLVSAVHTGPFNYLQDVPLVFYGPPYITAQGDVTLGREVTVADIGPTIADLIEADFGGDRHGQVIDEALAPDTERSGQPRLVVVVVWDGGGWNVLNTWSEKWPFLKKLMAGGTSVRNAIVGSTPSITPPVHATIGTSVFPNRHGAVTLRIPEGGRMRNVYASGSPEFLEATTLADEYDRQTDNQARIGLIAGRDWHLGMIGHGSYIEDGDRDIAALIDTGKRKKFFVNEDYYTLPSYLEDVPGLQRFARIVDMSDGQQDGAWMGHSLEGSKSLFRSPVWDLFQTQLISAILKREDFGTDSIPDLFFTNFKQIDHLGHFFNMISAEVGESIRFADRALKRLVGFLNDSIGEGEWVLAFTADHGQSPHPTVVDGWPIDRDKLAQSVADHFGATVDEMIWDARPNGLWLNPDYMEREGINEIEIVRFLLNYRAKNNVREGAEVLKQFEDDLDQRLFSAVFPIEQLDRVWDCVRERAADGS
jgi:hypothetical protein